MNRLEDCQIKAFWDLGRDPGYSDETAESYGPIITRLIGKIVIQRMWKYKVELGCSRQQALESALRDFNIPFEEWKERLGWEI